MERVCFVQRHADKGGRGGWVGGGWGFEAWGFKVRGLDFGFEDWDLGLRFEIRVYGSFCGFTCRGCARPPRFPRTRRSCT